MKKLLLLCFIFTGITCYAQDIVTDKAGNKHNVKILSDTPDNLTVILESGQEVVYAKNTIKSYAYAEKSLPLNKAGQIEFQEVMDANGKTKDEIYTAAREWFAKTFVSANAVLQMEDKENGKLIGRAKGKYIAKLTPNAAMAYIHEFDFLLSVEAKDGRYRYTITDIAILPSFSQSHKQTAEYVVLSDKAYRSDGSMRPYNLGVKNALLDYFPSIPVSLNAAITSFKGDDNW